MVTGWREQNNVYRPGTLNFLAQVPWASEDEYTSRGPEASLTLWASAPVNRQVTTACLGTVKRRGLKPTSSTTTSGVLPKRVTGQGGSVIVTVRPRLSRPLSGICVCGGSVRTRPGFVS